MSEVFCVQIVETNLGKCEWVWEEILRWLNPRWQNEDGRIQDGCHHQVNQIELVWVRVRVEWECFWVNLREDNKVSESNMAVAESNISEFKMAAIIKLNENEWLKFFVQNGLFQDGRIQDGCHHQVRWEWMSEVVFCTNCGNQSWQSVSEFEKKYYVGWIQGDQF